MTLDAPITLRVSDRWDHRLAPEAVITQADFAILVRYPFGVRRVYLVLNEGHPLDTGKAGSLYYTSLRWCEGNGLLYDADGSISRSYLGEMVGAGVADLTGDWAECERFLDPSPLTGVAQQAAAEGFG
ncbi:MAG: hypothetical protein CMM84_03860 [Rhodothermaceae bacterium]|nr:hypothetical protein [Rhodothermaceae bacterium]MBC15353.1 hypothetical protein [Rhodothermaceae bacterium]